MVHLVYTLQSLFNHCRSPVDKVEYSKSRHFISKTVNGRVTQIIIIPQNTFNDAKMPKTACHLKNVILYNEPNSIQYLKRQFKLTSKSMSSGSLP